MKLCECGCGKPSPISQKTRTKQGHKMGEPARFINGHNNRGKTGEQATGWKGGTTINAYGHSLIFDRNHNRSQLSGYVYKHIVIVESVIGFSLPPKAVVHHFDSSPNNNEKKNLVVCENNAYHLLLHARTRAYMACGEASYLKCRFCKEYDDPKYMYVRIGKREGYHRKCFNEHHKNKRIAKKAGWSK